MSKEQISKLFKDFSQVDSSITRKYGGTGLGLAISKKIINLMGGVIFVESDIGIGSRFYFSLEFGISKDQEKKNKIILPEFMKNLNILIVDDNDTARDVAENFVSEITPNYKSVISCDEAITELETSAKKNIKYDLILLDWNMPEKDGIETWKLIKEDYKIIYKPKVILVTAYSRESVFKQAEEENITDILIKPINSSVLFNRIIDMFDINSSNIYYDPKKREAYSSELDKIRGSRILVGEDNDINQQIIKEILESEGFLVDITGNGSICVDKFKKEGNYDLILMDLQMPDMDGFTATDIIRNRLNNKEIKIISLSADVMKETIEKIMQSGMNDYISKPIDVNELFNKLIKWIKPKNNNEIVNKVNKTENYNYDFPEIKSIDINDGLKRLSGNKELFKKILISFKKDNIDFVNKMKRLLDKNDIKEARMLSHTYKGTSANIGATVLYKKVTELDDLLKNDDFDDGILNNLLNEIDKINYNLFQEIELIELNEKDDIVLNLSSKDNNINLNILIIKNLKLLLEDLKDNNFKAMDKFSEIKQQFNYEIYSENFIKIEQSIENFDFNNAIISTEEFIKKLS